MTEETLMYHFYAKRLLVSSEVQQLATIGMKADDGAQVKLLYSQSSGDNLHCSAFTNGSNKIFNIRYYPSKKLYTLDIHVMQSNMRINITYTKHLEELIKKYLDDIGAFERFYCLPAPIRRGEALWRYFINTDERMYESSVTRLVEERQSKFQNIKIYWAEQLGHVLYLEDDANFGEFEQESYTRVLLGLETGKPQRINYEGKEVLILGGGDGGAICELLKQKPRMVTMCEIDQDVVQLCAKYMRNACEDALDTMEGPCKKIIIGDCLSHLHECIQAGKKYDIIVNDLTEFPVNKEDRGWDYDFATHNNQMMEIALKALKPDGHYLSRGGCINCKFYWSAFEADCRKLGLQFDRRQSYVPSFYDIYLFFHVRHG